MIPAAGAFVAWLLCNRQNIEGELRLHWLVASVNPIYGAIAWKMPFVGIVQGARVRDVTRDRHLI